MSALAALGSWHRMSTQAKLDVLPHHDWLLLQLCTTKPCIMTPHFTSTLPAMCLDTSNHTNVE